MATPSKTTTTKPAEEERPKCRFCTERYAMMQGRLSNIYVPFEATYCPRCGRKLKEEDRKF